MPTKILIVAANPWDSKRLGLDEEYREIKNIWQQSKQREQFVLEYAPAAREAELRQALLDFEPNIIHFSGHGELNGLFFMDDNGNSQLISKPALASLFALFSSQIRCVVLNACYSEEQALSIAEKIEHVIGMNKAIGDLAAIKFATGFYQALFSGRDIAFAHEFARNTLDLANIPEKDTPVLIVRQQSSSQAVKNYLSDYQYDVLVHIAGNEKAWAEILIQHLQKHLNQRFPHGLNLHLQTDINADFETSATSLLLLSPAYSANYAKSLDSITPTLKQQRLFLAEYQPVERPQTLNGLLSYCFWQNDPTQGLRSFSPADHDYNLQLENLAQDIEKRLKALYQQQQLKITHAQVKATFSSNQSSASYNDSVVFVNVSAEDRLLAQQVQQSLGKNGIASTLPIDQSLNPPPADIRRDIEINLLNCDAVLVIYGASSPLWVKEQLLLCHRWQRKREEPLKIIALHHEQYETNARLPDILLPNLQVFYCPPDCIDDYLVRFIEALK
ncbi:MAG: CHAT domain-containing protein [Candidatus Methylumidiphilus sp.]